MAVKQSEYIKAWSKQRAADVQGEIVQAVLDATQATIPDLSLIANAEEKVGALLAEILRRSLEAGVGQP